MRLRTSTEGLRAALMVAIAGTACGGVTRQNDEHPTKVGRGDMDAGAGGASSGGAASGGSSTGGISSGGRMTSNGGASTGGRMTSSGGASTGGVSTGGASTGGASTGGGAPVIDPRYTTCNNPVPMAPTGGFEYCDSGVTHRKMVEDCASTIDPNGSPTTKSPMDECTKNSDCMAKPHGYCSSAFQPGFPPGGAKCLYGCVRDSECGTDGVCLCGSPVGTCVSAKCKSDGDCSGHLMCVETQYGNFSCGALIRFNCGPLCVTDADCAPLMVSAPMKCMQGNCSEQGPVCGRPFLVQGAARTARAARRTEWCDRAAPDVSGLSPAAREKLAAHYTAIALMEHASIAAFARFTMELLAVGAPADLVALAGEAMQDETRHARVCFGLASAYAGRHIGPGPLPVAGALEASSLEERLVTAFAEACLGETVAALEVAEAAHHATDAAVTSLLHGIAEDEMRHAALGFRFVKWALGTLSSSSRSAAIRSIEGLLCDQIRASESRGGNNADAALARHGLLPDELVQRVRRAAVSDVVVPCVRQLVEEAFAA